MLRQAQHEEFRAENAVVRRAPRAARLVDRVAQPADRRLEDADRRLELLLGVAVAVDRAGIEPLGHLGKARRAGVAIILAAGYAALVERLTGQCEPWGPLALLG